MEEQPEQPEQPVSVLEKLSSAAAGQEAESSSSAKTGSSSDPGPVVQSVDQQEDIAPDDNSTVACKRSLPRRRPRSGTKRSAAEYAIKFSGNDSERWDGKVISIDAEWLEELYPKTELGPGRIVELPWEGRDGKDVGWRAIVMQVPTKPTTEG